MIVWHKNGIVHTACPRQAFHGPPPVRHGGQHARLLLPPVRNTSHAGHSLWGADGSDLNLVTATVSGCLVLIAAGHS
jgi:hypothetical protein